MTFTEIVGKVADRLNLTSTTALTRIGDSVNERYRALASSCGLNTIQRTTATRVVTIGTRSVVFGPTPIGVEKILSVFNTTLSTTNPQVLGERSFDELRNQPAMTGDQPQEYAIQLMGSSSVTVFLDTIPATAYTLSADVLSNLTTLSGTNVPAFAEDYHDILIVGAMATELDKMEKYDLSKRKEDQYQIRLSDLRMYVASSAYKRIYQNKGMGRGRHAPLVS